MCGVEKRCQVLIEDAWDQMDLFTVARTALELDDAVK